MQRIAFYISFLLILSTESFGSSIFEEVSNKIKSKIKKVTLENGLRLIMMKRESSATLALYIKFKVGSVDETADMAGTAHLLEHMMFKGTKNVGTLDYSKEEKYQEQTKVWGRELDRLRLLKREKESKGEVLSDELKNRIGFFTKRLRSLEEMQSQFIVKNEDSFIYEQNGQVGFNAYTTYDVTNYQIELPKNRLEIWAKLESDRLMFPIFREFYTEREVIQEERRMRVENRGTGKLREKFLGVAFDEHPYRRPVIGYESNIPFLDPAETEKFFRKFYAPNNLVIGIVGDQDFDETEKLVRKYFAPLKPSKQPEPIRTSEKLGEGEKRLTVKFPSGPSLMMGWHKPSFPHPDNDIFEVIDSILSKGTESRLYKKIVLKEKLALSIDAWSGDPGERYSNLFTVFSQINSDADPAKIEKMVWEEIEKLKNESVTQEEMTRIKNNLIADFLRHLDHNGNIADALTYYELITGDWENLFRSYDRIYTVSPEDIRRVAKKYLRPDNVTVGNLVNSGKQ